MTYAPDFAAAPRTFADFCESEDYTFEIAQIPQYVPFGDQCVQDYCSRSQESAVAAFSGTLTELGTLTFPYLPWYWTTNNGVPAIVYETTITTSFYTCRTSADLVSLKL